MLHLGAKGGINMEYILSKFSHELRNPLTSVYSTVQLIETMHPEVKEFKYWSNISNDLEYMNRLLTDLSDFSKSERLISVPLTTATGPLELQAVVITPKTTNIIIDIIFFKIQHPFPKFLFDIITHTF